LAIIGVGAGAPWRTLFLFCAGCMMIELSFGF
jgi:hypothetical protein